MIRKTCTLSFLGAVIAGNAAIADVNANDANTAVTQEIPLNNVSHPNEKKGPDEQAENSSETMVVTAKEQTLQAPGVSIIDSEAIKKNPSSVMSPKLSVPCRA